MTSGFFNPAGPIAAAQSHLVITMVALMLVVVVPMFIVLAFVARRYRAGNSGNTGNKDSATDAKYEPEFASRHGSQILLWIIPATLIATLGVLNWQSAHALDPSQAIAPSSAAVAAGDAQPLTIEVVALPWKWLFIYPAQHIATVNVIEFPVGTPVHFELTADAPMSSFWIPQLGSQIYAMAAMMTQLNLEASTTGEFTGRDTEINGEGYAGMTFAAWSVAPGPFEDWIESIQQATSTFPALDANAYATFAAPSENNPAAYYSSVAPGLFDGIIMQYMELSTTMAAVPEMETGTATAASSTPTGTMDMPAGMNMQM